jgi:hypothetical protein
MSVRPAGDASAQTEVLPPKALEVATLDVRPAEAIKGVPCGIYELDAYFAKMTKGKKTRRTSMIFTDSGELEAHLKKYPTKSAASKELKFVTESYIPVSEADLRLLTSAEVAIYKQEKSEQSKL